MGENTKKTAVTWFLYLIETCDKKLYTGITTDVQRRFKQHQQGKGARFLRGKGPLELRFSKAVGGHSQALKIEYQLKRWPRAEKLALIAGSRALPELSV